MNCKYRKKGFVEWLEYYNGCWVTTVGLLDIRLWFYFFRYSLKNSTFTLSRNAMVSKSVDYRKLFYYTKHQDCYLYTIFKIIENVLLAMKFLSNIEGWVVLYYFRYFAQYTADDDVFSPGRQFVLGVPSTPYSVLCFGLIWWFNKPNLFTHYSQLSICWWSWWPDLMV